MHLTTERQSFYQTFAERLQVLAQEVRRYSDVDHSNIPLQAWMMTFNELQQDFQVRVIANFDRAIITDPLSPGHHPPTHELAAKVRSIETELYRVLKLLPTDLMFLKSANQAQTVRVRWQQLSDRLAAASNFCDVLLNLDKV